MRPLKRAVRGVLNALGMDVQRYRDPHLELSFLRRVGVRTVLDIGANAGQFAAGIRTILPEAEIHSFEPVPSVFAELQRASSGDPRRHAHGFALGEREGTAEIEVNDFTPASSLLPMVPASNEAFPYASHTVRKSIEVRTLDGWAAGNRLEEPLFVKLDVQGYEDRVMAGGRSTLGRACAVLSEVSFHPVYQGQRLFEEMASAWREMGFAFAGTFGNIVDPGTGVILQADALFVKGAALQEMRRQEATG